MVELLVANTAHGFVALIWLLSLRRLAGPLPPGSWAQLLELAVALPLLATAARSVDALTPPAWMTLLRAGRWSEGLASAGPSLWVPALALGGGTALLFFGQELLPRLRDTGGAPLAGHPGGERLRASLERVKVAFLGLGDGAGSRRGRARLARSRVQLVDSERRRAALDDHGTAPTVSISRGLADALDDDALDAVIAHELAHLLVSGRLRLLLLWLARLPQAASPGVLLLFRSLIESRESACDALAARATGQPLALAAALLEAHRFALVGGADDGSWARAQRRVLRRAEVASVRARVEHLRAHATAGAELSAPVRLLAVALLGGLLWLVG